MSSFKTKVALGLSPLVLADTAAVETVAIDVNWPDAGATIAAGDVIQLCDLPVGVDAIDWKFISDDIDSNAAPTVAFTLGVLNAGKTAIGAGPNDAWSAAGAINCAQTAGSNSPAGATAANAFLTSRNTVKTLGLVATAGCATPSLAGKRAVLLLDIRQGSN